MNIIITGSSGFIGTNFIKSNLDFQIKEVDLIKLKPNEIDFQGIDSVLHLAALVHQKRGASVESYYTINRDLAYNVARLAKESGVRHFILMSTVKVFGESTQGTTIWNDNSTCLPLDTYGKSKLEAEILIKSLEDERFAVAIIRSPLVYGPGVKANMFNLIHLVDRFSVLPFGNINNRRTVVFVGNLIALINQILILKASGIYIAGDRTPLSTTWIICEIARCLNKKIVLLRLPNLIYKALGLTFPSKTNRLFGSLELDIEQTNKRLHFIPPFSSSEGIRNMVNWYLTLKTDNNLKEQM